MKLEFDNIEEIKEFMKLFNSNENKEEITISDLVQDGVERLKKAEKKVNEEMIHITTPSENINSGRYPLDEVVKKKYSFDGTIYNTEKPGRDLYCTNETVVICISNMIASELKKFGIKVRQISDITSIISIKVKPTSKLYSQSGIETNEIQFDLLDHYVMNKNNRHCTVTLDFHPWKLTDVHKGVTAYVDTLYLDYEPEQKTEEFKVDLNVVKKLDKDVKEAVKPIKKEYTMSTREVADKYHLTTSAIGVWRKLGLDCERRSSHTIYYNEKDVEEFAALHHTPGHSKAGREKLKIEGKPRPSSYVVWKNDNFSRIRAKGLDEGKTCSEIFKRMTNKYGVVWDQVKKDFYKAHGYPSRSTLQACYWWCNNSGESTENLFDACLGSYLEEVK